MSNKYDILIIGAGLSGVTMAIALAGKGVSTCVIESGDLTTIKSRKLDGRTCAIAHGSKLVFEDIGVWSYMQKNAGKILDIRVTDNESPLFLHYDHRSVGNDPMGYIIENYHIRDALFKKAAELDNLSIIDKVNYTNIEPDQRFVELEDGSKLNYNLLIVADGRNSRAAKKLGVKSVVNNYNQHGIVCTVKHEKHHNFTAQEKFLKAGPFAILPMEDGYHSSLVWTEKSDLIPLFMEMDEAEFLEQIELRFGSYLGGLKVVSPRFSYPLVLVHAKHYTGSGFALIGDAAHGIHPLAGQGFNLGIRDVEVLVQLIVNQVENGLDLAGNNILSEYEKQRKFDSMSLIAITNYLNILFSNNITGLKLARRVGMSAVNKIKPLKKVLIKHAMGM